MILLRVKDLEKRRGRIAAAPSASRSLTELVHFVQQQHRVEDVHPGERRDDAAGHRSHVGAPVSAQLRFVAHPAQSNPNELSSQGVRDALANAGLPHSRRTTQTQDRRLNQQILGAFSLVPKVLLQEAPSTLKLPDRKEMLDAFLHLYHAQVILIELAAKITQRALFRPWSLVSPRQRDHELEIPPKHPVLRLLRGQLFQPLEILHYDCLRPVWHLERVQLPTELLNLARIVALTPLASVSEGAAGGPSPAPFLWEWDRLIPP
mmetsp:Transcript_18847/g.71337  ORF Transcript_18847/g.71337 Transcript_18847/m.71337 type:complete len:263 (+) Transcript_18847:2308-3096(+)